MAFTVLRATYFKRTNRSFEDSDYESFGIVNEKGKLTNAGALLADYSPVRHSRLFCTRWNGVDKANGVMDALDDGGIVNMTNNSVYLMPDDSSLSSYTIYASRLPWNLPDSLL